ncbi:MULTISPECIES: alpha/beta fold hydrolase [unclassified Streptomyces]|uniref:alpha/beta fold hydrolase n=1 Tax=unclassified Streptomyces TaxID=2593676 RepID=UPI00224D0A39|nr:MULTISPECIES: alpha/beta fold hydrolase [unclassified Streptomyces]MCX4992497.1 alpha/beta fold hydrolase [Streptomyces sp. NBC_00568]MCX5002265.1 alpha/beta fold hydrolase [Streptomyces sp. NBC_00638]
MSDTVSVSLPSSRGPRAVTLSYARVGAGEPLLLLHGIGHHRQAWDPVIPILAAERDVIAVDLPGFGASPALPEGLTHDLATVVPVLGALCEALEIERPHVAGNSLGGLLALELGREKLVRSVTALSPAGFWSPVERRYAFGVLLAMRQAARRMPLPIVERLSRSAAGRAVLTSTIYARPGRRSPDAVVAETLALAHAEGFTETLRAGTTVQFTDDIPTLPVTVAWGTRDRLLVRRQGIRAKQIIPRARLVRLPGCGHVPMNDDPALVARVILDGSS